VVNRNQDPERGAAFAIDKREQFIGDDAANRRLQVGTGDRLGELAIEKPQNASAASPDPQAAAGVRGSPRKTTP